MSVTVYEYLHETNLLHQQQQQNIKYIENDKPDQIATFNGMCPGTALIAHPTMGMAQFRTL